MYLCYYFVVVKHPSQCSHGVIVRAPLKEGKKGTGIDDDVRAYSCTVCGFLFVAAAAAKFKDDPEAIEFFRKQAEMIQIQIPKSGRPEWIPESEIKPDAYDGVVTQKNRTFKIFSNFKLRK